MQLIVKFLAWFGGIIWRELTSGGWDAGGSGLPKGTIVPRPYTEQTKNKAKALEVENEVLQKDAEVDHEKRSNEIKADAEVLDAEGRVVGYNFDSKS